MNRFMFFSRSGATTVAALSPVFMPTMTRKSKTILKIVGSIGQFDQQQQAAADYSVTTAATTNNNNSTTMVSSRQWQQQQQRRRRLRDGYEYPIHHHHQQNRGIIRTDDSYHRQNYFNKLSSVQRQRHNNKYHDQRQLQQRYGYLHVNNNNNNTFYQPNIKIVHSVSTFSTSSKSSLKSSSKLKEKEPVDEINAINLPLTSSSAPSSTTTISSSINLKSSNSNNSNDDIITNTGFVSYLPSSITPYAKLARIDRPIGTYLLLWPCLWSTALASSSYHHTVLDFTSVAAVSSAVPPPPITGDPYLLSLFIAGSFFMRGAGCTINDMWDSSYDRQVERTKNRPLANGDLNHTQAFAFLSIQTLLGLCILLSFPSSVPENNFEHVFYIATASLPLVICYPLAKRYTKYPQLVLGLAMNWGVFVGWTAVNGSLFHYDIGSGGEGCLDVVLPLYAGSVAWTIFYDTIYAHQDREDDRKLGLNSTALTFGGGGGTDNNNGSSSSDSDKNTSTLIAGMVSNDMRSKGALVFFGTIAAGGWAFAMYNNTKLGMGNTGMEEIITTPLSLGITESFPEPSTVLPSLSSSSSLSSVSIAVSKLFSPTSWSTWDIQRTGCIIVWCHMMQQVLGLNLNDKNNLARRFRSNGYVTAPLLYGTIVLGNAATVASAAAGAG